MIAELLDALRSPSPRTSYCIDGAAAVALGATGKGRAKSQRLGGFADSSSGEHFWPRIGCRRPTGPRQGDGLRPGSHTSVAPRSQAFERETVFTAHACAHPRSPAASALSGLQARRLIDAERRWRVLRRGALLGSLSEIPRRD